MTSGGSEDVSGVHDGGLPREMSGPRGHSRIFRLDLFVPDLLIDWLILHHVVFGPTRSTGLPSCLCASPVSPDPTVRWAMSC
ncbi:hypothetical protein CA850_24935 [Micromonospora echinospora]|nr:hypothetical protein CA850_24935 [Micromonospora echinospora]